MRLGLLGGFLTGTVLSGLVLGAVSYMTDVPGQKPPEATNLDVPAGSEFNQSREDEEASLPGADETPEGEGVPRVDRPEPDDLSSLGEVDMTPALQPETGSAEGTLEAPEVQHEGSAIELVGDEPVLPSPQALAPDAPEAEADPAVSSETAEPRAPEPEPEPASEPEPEEETSISAEPVQPAAPEVEEDSGVVRPEAETAEDELAEEEEAEEEAAGQAPTEQEKPAEDTEEEAPARDDPATDEAGDEESSAPAVPEEEDDALSSTIGDLAEGVTTNRLPSVTDDNAPEEEPLPPLQKYAAPFENPENKPLMAIVLIDDGSGPVSHEALADFPYPISYAVDANWPGSAEAARKYRAAGLEVLAMADLPEGASARDTEVAMQVFLDAVPEAVAVMEGTDTGLQSSREATEQLVPILQDSGHGLVLFSDGLDTAQKLIAREGVPVAPVFRDFDSERQNATVIRRFLDQAAFKAGQGETGVIMVGRLRAETVSALLLWGLQDRAASVALAPVSAVLQNAQ